jgi:5-methylcytosine-specific restriction endonuclease McrA
MKILRGQEGLCAYCSAQAEEFDHKITLFNGGPSWPWNMQWLCKHHNRSKGRRNDDEYRRAMGYPATGKFLCVEAT